MDRQTLKMLGVAAGDKYAPSQEELDDIQKLMLEQVGPNPNWMDQWIKGPNLPNEVPPIQGQSMQEVFNQMRDALASGDRDKAFILGDDLIGQGFGLPDFPPDLQMEFSGPNTDKRHYSPDADLREIRDEEDV